jgi:hypothetical protein
MSRQLTKREYQSLLREAFEKYLERFSSTEVENSLISLSYDFSFLADRHWYMFLSDTMVKCELQEMTNVLHRWSQSLARWKAWNLVLVEYDEDTEWLLRREFLDATAHECLLRPSSVRDAFTAISTNAFHQVRLSIQSRAEYPDKLVGDQEKPERRGKLLSRSGKEERLAAVLSHWEYGADLVHAISVLDGEEYRNQTSDYRNANSHNIGPKLGFGHTGTVVRFVSQANKLEEQEDGTYRKVLVEVAPRN